MQNMTSYKGFNVDSGHGIETETHDGYCVVGGQALSGIIVLCDHANNALPEGYGRLGLSEDQLRRHIAYDIGAAAVTRQVADELSAPAVLTRYSRLLIDPNRGEDDPTMIMRLSDGAIIPGNRQLELEERKKRISLYYRPYHNAISQVIDRCLAAGYPPVLLSIHSFTESWKETARPWHVGILWDADERLAQPLLDHFYASSDLIVGNNKPYTGRLPGDTMWRHGTQRGLAHAIVEIRQDLIGDIDGQAEWAQRIVAAMRSIFSDPANVSAFRTIGPADAVSLA